MPTIFTHGVVALALAAKTRGIEIANRKRLLIVAFVCAMLPDIDFFGFQAGIQYNSLFGHRGFTHSFFFAAIVAFVVAWFLQKKRDRTFASFGKLFVLLFAVTGSHTILDAMTDGGEGVAFFSPFSNHRYFFPWRPIMVSPLGLFSFFKGWYGTLVLIDEILVVILPIAFFLYLPEIWRTTKAKKAALAIGIVIWALALATLNGLNPMNNISMTINGTEHPIIELYEKQYRSENPLRAIPLAGMPEGVLVLNFNELESRGVFGRKIETNNVNRHWAAGFFANWYGGIGGRWQDPNYRLLLRTFFGYGTPDYQNIRDVLRESADSPEKQEFLFRLSPTEKYDLMLGDYNFSATRAVSKVSHNSGSLPQYWYGICNGMAAAAKFYEEPFRTVDVINPNGFKIRFHPNDIKALMGYSLSSISDWTQIGVLCNINGPESESCRVNAGAFFIAAANRIGLAHDAFIVDGFAGTRKQFFLFDGMKMEILRGPTPVEEFKDLAVPTSVKSLADVEFQMDLVSTLLSDKAGNERDPEKNETYYKKVGRVLEHKTLKATIALDETGKVIGGAWLGEDDVPDLFYFFGPEPAMDDQERLKLTKELSWRTIKQLYQKSIAIFPEPIPLDFSN